MKRQRGRGRNNSSNKSGGGGGHNRAFDSNGPENTKVRGSGLHVYEKYLQLARDANSSGDRVLAESYLQHAEHYFRLVKATQPHLIHAGHTQVRDRFDGGINLRDAEWDDDGEGEDGDEGADASAEGGEGSEEGGDQAQEPRRQEPRRFDNRQRDGRDGRDNNRNRDGRNFDRDGRDRDGRDRDGRDRDGRDRDGRDRDGRDRDGRSFDRDGRADREPRDNRNVDREPRDNRGADRDDFRRRRDRPQRFRQDGVDEAAPVTSLEAPEGIAMGESSDPQTLVRENRGDGRRSWRDRGPRRRDGEDRPEAGPMAAEAPVERDAAPADLEPAPRARRDLNDGEERRPRERRPRERREPVEGFGDALPAFLVQPAPVTGSGES